ncbi:MAG: sigma 54-interacting transcriptional regulator [Spirochaetes bacterium]|nr:sigma 54-interacting transcriptional regulator [Spirochaetota bacterium]
MRAVAYWDIDVARIKAVRNELEIWFDLRIATTFGELRDLLAKVRIDALVLGTPKTDSAAVASILESLAKDVFCPVFALVDISSASPAYSLDRAVIVCGTELPLLRHKIASAIGGMDRYFESESRIFIGRSEAIRKVAATVRKYADSEHPVLVYGETGTGKELAANALHYLSSRRDAAFIALNCSALPENLVESELFGTERGAFTDAVRHEGALSRAEGGTLFLDEVGSMAIAVQPKLLRALESGEYWRLGADKSERSDFRLVCATCENLVNLSERRLFRTDLLYRISDLVVAIPPLRERLEDVRILSEHFCAKSGKGFCSLSEEAVDRLEAYSWPGNVRELKSVINRACANVQSGTIRADDIVFITLFGDRGR